MNEEHFLAARLRRVCRLTGLAGYADMDDSTLSGCAGTVLGMIASKLESIDRLRDLASRADSPVGEAAGLIQIGWLKRSANYPDTWDYGEFTGMWAKVVREFWLPVYA